MKKLYLSFVILTTSFLLVACGGGSSSPASSPTPTDTDTDTDTTTPSNESANGLWSFDDDQGSQVIGVFNEGSFIILDLDYTDDSLPPIGVFYEGSYAIEVDQLESDSAKAYLLNDLFLGNGTVTGTVAEGGSLNLIGKDGDGGTQLETTLFYDEGNAQEIELANLEGSWIYAAPECEFELPGNDAACEFSISEAGAVTLNTADCALEGTISETATNNIFSLAVSISGSSCWSPGDYVGFSTFATDIDDEGFSSEELIMMLSDGTHSYGIQIFKLRP